MWTRRDLKERAKLVLRSLYWKAFGVSIVIAVAGGDGYSRGGGSDNHRNSIDSLASNLSLETILLILIVSVTALVFAIAFRIFLGYPLEVGGRRFFVKSAQYKENQGCFKFAFTRENYMGIILTMLLKGVQNFLWFMLLIIPGVVKAYAYSMVPYILADNPNIGCKKAIKLSNEMTEGHKFDMFVLDLSFIGWYLLGVLALVVGVLFVMPYENATKAELYLVLRKNALESNMCSYEDLLIGDFSQQGDKY